MLLGWLGVTLYTLTAHRRKGAYSFTKLRYFYQLLFVNSVPLFIVFHSSYFKRYSYVFPLVYIRLLYIVGHIFIFWFLNIEVDRAGQGRASTNATDMEAANRQTST